LQSKPKTQEGVQQSCLPRRKNACERFGRGSQLGFGSVFSSGFRDLFTQVCTRTCRNEESAGKTQKGTRGHCCAFHFRVEHCRIELNRCSVITFFLGESLFLVLSSQEDAGMVFPFQGASSCEESACETYDGFLGVAGECKNSTCVCPEGWSTSDDWTKLSFCGVDTSLQNYFHVASLVLALVTFVVALFCMGVLVWRWDLLGLHTALERRTSRLTPKSSAARMSSVSSSSSSSNEEGFNQQEATERAKQNIRRKKLARQKAWLRKRWTVGAIGLSLTYNLGLFIYFGLLLSGTYRFNRNFLLDFGLWMATASIFTAIYCFFSVFYLQLPPLRAYGGLFGVDNILLHRPKLVQRSIVGRCVAVPVILLVLVLVVPYALDPSQSTRDTLDTVFLIVLCLLALDLFVFTLTLLVILRKLFSQLTRLADESIKQKAVSKNDKHKFEKAVNTIRICQFVVILLSPATCAITACLALTPFLRQHLYLFNSFPFAFGNIGVLLMVFILLVRMRRRHAKKSETRTVASFPSETV